MYVSVDFGQKGWNFNEGQNQRTPPSCGISGCWKQFAKDLNRNLSKSSAGIWTSTRSLASRSLFGQYSSIEACPVFTQYENSSSHRLDGINWYFSKV